MICRPAPPSFAANRRLQSWAGLDLEFYASAPVLLPTPRAITATSHDTDDIIAA
jgi:hypothetical protein